MEQYLKNVILEMLFKVREQYQQQRQQLEKDNRRRQSKEQPSQSNGFIMEGIIYLGDSQDSKPQDNSCVAEYSCILKISILTYTDPRDYETKLVPMQIIPNFERQSLQIQFSILQKFEYKVNISSINEKQDKIHITRVLQLREEQDTHEQYPLETYYVFQNYPQQSQPRHITPIQPSEHKSFRYPCLFQPQQLFLFSEQQQILSKLFECSLLQQLLLTEVLLEQQYSNFQFQQETHGVSFLQLNQLLEHQEQTGSISKQLVYNYYYCPLQQQVTNSKHPNDIEYGPYTISLYQQI
ncbi:hypothetical protein ABPG72_007195 [Tetrahymena utriculariae]